MQRMSSAHMETDEYVVFPREKVKFTSHLFPRANAAAT